MQRTWVTVEGNEAVANVAHTLSEVIAIYPITPSTPMGELADAWSAAERTNLWGTVPLVAEMQSEGGAAGAIHGALQTGALSRDPGAFHLRRPFRCHGDTRHRFRSARFKFGAGGAGPGAHRACLDAGGTSPVLAFLRRLPYLARD